MTVTDGRVSVGLGNQARRRKVVVVAAGARAVPGAAVERDPLGRVVVDVELGARRVQILVAHGAGVEDHAVERVGDAAHLAVERAGGRRLGGGSGRDRGRVGEHGGPVVGVQELRVRGDVDVEVLVRGLGARALQALFIAGRLVGRLARAVGLVVRAARGDDRPLRDALGRRDRFRVGCGRAVRGAGVATIIGRARWRRAGRAQQREDDESVQRRHLVLPSPYYATFRLPLVRGCPC
mmetsp:Transcript_7207/g.22515  ORF Transcript_7207/g.22515 Transcript_7207/m.22515 type:complete len:237 (-) Transcript_7207:62-772(-)